MEIVRPKKGARAYRTSTPLTRNGLELIVRTCCAKQDNSECSHTFLSMLPRVKVKREIGLSFENSL